MPSIVGFTLARGVTAACERRALAAQRLALRHFPALASESLLIGETTLSIWGHPHFQHRVWRAADGATSVLVGSPHGQVDWQRTAPGFPGEGDGKHPEIPWEGRTIVVRASDGGRRWDMWTDWVGSIPVYHARCDHGWIASTIEPVVVAAAGFSSDHIAVPALLSQLVDGHFFADATLFTGMKVVPPDCHAAWRHDSFYHERLWTVSPSCDRWETEWDDLVDEMHALASEAIRVSLNDQPRWLLPLSGGLDSRLIAAVATQLGTGLRAFTWGNAAATDVVCGRQVARQLDVPWQRLDLGTDYLLTQTVPWTDVFGSSMHLHGMYQMEFYRRLRRPPHDPVISGYLGDVLSGYANAELVAANSSPDDCQLITDSYHHWTVNEATELLTPPTRDDLAGIRNTIAATVKSLPGAMFQRAILLNVWNRQRRFTGFSASIADLEKGVSTPYMSRRYARFCLSLPKAALDGRRLLADVFRRHYPRLAAIPGTYGPAPHLLTGRYLLQRRLASWMPFAFRAGRFRMVRVASDLECVRAHRWNALWPIREAWERLEPWVDLDKVNCVAEAVFTGRDGTKGVRKLQSIQCLAYRLRGVQPAESGGPPS